MSLYRELLDQLRTSFPPPASDPVHDGYVVFSLLRALDQVDRMKTTAPILGEPREMDYERAADAEMEDAPRSVEEVIPRLVQHLEGMVIWGHPRSQVNVVAYPSIASIIGVILSSMYNPNLCSDESSLGFAEVELRVSSMISDLVGYDRGKARGVFTFGGTGTLMYGVKLGLEKALPGTRQHGLAGRACILTSDQGHYCALNVAGWLGLGQEQVVHVPTYPDNSIRVDALERAARERLDEGIPIAAIIATMGSTDAFGIDDLQAIIEMRDKLVDEYALSYTIHVHADAVIGWAWSVFNDYDVQENPMGFRGRTLRAMAAAANRIRHLGQADSLGIDFHKTGFAPYISSLFIVRDREDLRLLVRDPEEMPYVFQSGSYHPGMFTLETSRAATGPMAAFASCDLLGKQGFRALLGHAVEMAEILRERVSGRPELSVLNDQNHGPVTLFRAYPDGVDTFQAKEQELHNPEWRERIRQHNDFNRAIFERVHTEALTGQGVAIGYTEKYRCSDEGEPISALKSYVISPFASEKRMQTVVERVLDARKQVS